VIVAVLVVLPGRAGPTIPAEEEAAGAVGSRPGWGAPGRFLPEGVPFAKLRCVSAAAKPHRPGAA
jgi:hypothetical protein